MIIAYRGKQPAMLTLLVVDGGMVCKTGVEVCGRRFDIVILGSDLGRDPRPLGHKRHTINVYTISTSH